MISLTLEGVSPARHGYRQQVIWIHGQSRTHILVYYKFNRFSCMTILSNRHYQTSLGRIMIRQSKLTSGYLENVKWGIFSSKGLSLTLIEKWLIYENHSISPSSCQQGSEYSRKRYDFTNLRGLCWDHNIGLVNGLAKGTLWVEAIERKYFAIVSGFTSQEPCKMR